MGFLRGVLGKGRRPEDQGGLAEHMEFLDSLRLPAIALVPDDGRSFSKVGGLPSLPDDLAWPAWQGAPLSFLCQLDLAELPHEPLLPEFPTSGLLYFFYDQEQSTWGFDPKDRGSWRVLYARRTPDECSERARPASLKKEYVYRETPVSFCPILTYPDYQDERVYALGLRNKRVERYIDLCLSVYPGGTHHQLFGHALPIQGNEMDLECQLVSNGLYCGDASGRNDPRAKELEGGRSEWVLLLQLDTDDRAGMMWGDMGMLYFWIRKDDLREGRFEDCWMILQCS